MSFKEIIVSIRNKNELTQEDFAQRLFITRQAVSRWENGETTPSIDMLKKIAELFGVDANYILGLDETPVCQSCAMPLMGLDDFGTNPDKTINTEFCIHCFKEGKFTHNRTLEEMIESNLRFLNEFNAANGTQFSEAEARDVLKHHLATLKRWKKD